ncbi:MAG TPA: hypothetical protein VD927_05475 [Chryseosolibacter sp.]|nr:hypothetical protein [Chryseosolibacter sp.]
MISLLLHQLLLSGSIATFGLPPEKPIVVPTVENCRTVMTDGIIEADEWKGAHEILIDGADSTGLLIKQDTDFIYIAIRTRFQRLSYVDLYIQADDENTILNLHSSSQIGERILSDTLFTDTSPAFHFGNQKEWYANEIRFDRIKAQELVAANPNRDRNLMQLETNYYYDGFEYLLKKSRFSYKRMRVRAEIKTGMPGHQNIFYPKASLQKHPETWQEFVVKGN